jgi:hypothetical protein
LAASQSTETKATDPSGSQESKVVSLASRRRSLFTEYAVDNVFGFFRNLELFDVSQLVLDSSATRSDLRIIEESDDEVQQCLETRLDTLLGVDWRLDGGSESTRMWLTEQLERHYSTIVTNAFSSRLYGYSVQERVYEQVDGKIIVNRVSEKPFEWFVPRRDGTLWYKATSFVEHAMLPDIRGGVSETWEGGVPVDTSLKFLLTRHKPTWKNPRGVALLAFLFWPWFYRKATWQFWMQFLERNGTPLLVGKSANPAQIAQQLSMAVADAVVGVPKDADVEAIQANNKGESFGLAEDRLVRRIQKVLLGQTLTSDSGGDGKGAKALGQVHNEVRLDKTIGDLKLIAPTVQNYIDALLTLNFPSSRPVKLVYAIDRGLESARANRDSTLINSGNVEFTAEYWIRAYGFKQDEIKVKSPSATKQQPKDNKETNEENADGGNSVGKDKDETDPKKDDE